MEVISQDEQKRLEYLARQKAIGDYNTLMYESREEGVILGKFQTLTDLVKKGLLSITDAAAQANMTEAEFKEKAGL